MAARRITFLASSALVLGCTATPSPPTPTAAPPYPGKPGTWGAPESYSPPTSDPPDPPARVAPDFVIASLRTRFRECYWDGVRREPTMGGRVVFMVEVEGSSKVGKVGLRSREGTLSDEVVACLSLTIRRATFSPSRNGDSQWLAVPISFVQSDAGAAH